MPSNVIQYMLQNDLCIHTETERQVYAYTIEIDRCPFLRWFHIFVFGIGFAVVGLTVCLPTQLVVTDNAIQQVKGAITSKIKHAIKHTIKLKTSASSLAAS